MIRKFLTSIFRRLIKKNETNKNKQQCQTGVRFTIGFWISSAKGYWTKNFDGFLIYFQNEEEIVIFERVSKWIVVLFEILLMYRKHNSAYFSGLLSKHYKSIIDGEEFEYNGRKYKLFYEDIAFRRLGKLSSVGRYVVIKICDKFPILDVVKCDERIKVTIYDSDLKLTKILNVFEEGMETLFRLQDISIEEAFSAAGLSTLLLSHLEDKYDKVIVNNDSLQMQLDVPIEKVTKLLDMYAKRDEVLGIHISCLETKQLFIEFVLDYEKCEEILKELDIIKSYLGNKVIIKYRYGSTR